MSLEPVEPQGWKPPKGYANGIVGEGRMLFVAGQIGWDESQRFVTDDFVPQFRQALQNVVAVVRAAGGKPDDIARLTLFVTDKREYLKAIREVGEAYRIVMGKHFPAMSLVEVRALLEDRAKVEIEATALLGPSVKR